MGFFEWFNPREFMNTYQEWHAFVEGFSESFCFWKPRHELTGELKEDLDQEHHYYVFGRVIGFICLVLFGLLVAKILRGQFTTEKREYVSDRQWNCSKCNQPIKPRTPYYIEQKHIFVDEQPVIDVQRVHVKCPGNSEV